jgi:hypothetical protein
VGFGVGLPLAISLGSGLLAVALPAATMGVAFLGARQVYRHLVTGRRRAVVDLLETVAEVAREHIPEELPSKEGGRLGPGEPGPEPEGTR